MLSTLLDRLDKLESQLESWKRRLLGFWGFFSFFF
jgi:hypothetical protein